MDGPAEDDLLQACLAAPKHGLNAKTLILQAALAAGVDSDEDGSRGSPAKRQRTDPAGEAAAAAASRGSEYLAAVPAQQRPLVPYIARSKIPRIHRQTVLSRLAGQHLALAVHDRQPVLEPAAAAADEALRQGAWEAALAQEQELYGRCSSTVVYQNLAARTSATQWRPEQRQDWQQEAARPEAPVAQQRQAVEAQAAGQREEARQQQPTQQVSDGRQDGQQGPGTAAGPKRAPAFKQPQLEEVDIDWEAALPESLAEGSSAPTATGAAPSTGRTELGTGEFAPLSAGQQNSAACKPEAPAENEASKPTETAAPGAAPAAAEAERQRAPGGPKAAPAQAAGEAANAAPGLIRQQVELFVRAELHPMLQRRQISQELHDAVAARSAAKVMQRHAGASSADFLVTEAAAIRSLVQQYLKHLRQQQPQQQQQQQQQQP